MARVKVGSRMRSAVCSTEVMVVGAPDGDVEITCGGVPMIELGTDPPPGVSLAPEASGGTALGKRYVDESSDLELLCTKPGEGSLAVAGKPLAVKGAKPLPSSD